MSNNTIDDYSDILDKKAKSIAIDKLSEPTPNRWTENGGK